MAYVSRVEGGYGTGASVIHNDSAHHSVLVPDAELLVSGAYHRAGPDLVLTNPDGHHFIVPGYFSSEHPPALVAPNGMTLSGDMVEMLAGSPAPGEYAQAQPGMPVDGIGKIEKAVGDVTAVRNGVAVTLHVGDAVFKSDVIQTGAGSSVGISFPDGTALNLVANTRMGLNDYKFDPSSNSNDALFTLVEGTFAFVAGKVAHTGDMKISTPVATMGIRGTTGVVEEEVAAISATQNGVTYSFSVVADFGTGVAGMYDLIDANGNVVATVSQTGYVTYLTPQGVNLPPLVSVAPITNSQFAVEQDILQQLLQAVTPAVQQQQQQTPGNSTPPAPPPNPIPILLNGPATFTVPSPSGTPGNTPPPPITVTVVVTPPPPPPPPTTPTATQTVTWIGGSGGNWNVAGNWSDDVVPTSFSAIVLTAATIFVTDSETVNAVTVGPRATLDLVSGGSLTLANSDTGLGTVELDGTGGDPTLAISGTVFLLGPDPTVAAGGEILLNGPTANNLIVGVAGTDAKLVNVQDTIIGSGEIGQGDGNLTLVNGAEGTINATGLLIIDTGNKVVNSGLMEATAGGTLQIGDSVSNTGIVEATGADALVTMANAAFDNFGTISAQDQGAISFSGVTFTNESTGSVNATGGTITVDGGTVSNAGTVSAGAGGTLTIEDATVTNSDSGEVSIGATSNLSLVTAAILGGTVLNAGDLSVTGTSAIQGDTVTNTGDIAVGENASLTLEGSTSFNNAAGAQIEANGGGITINLDVNADVNDGTIEALDGGSVTININAEGSSNHGLIEAVGDGSSVTFSQNNHEDAAEYGDGDSDSGGNYGTMEATGGGVVTFNSGLDNYDLVEAAAGGTVDFTDDNRNHSGGMIESTGADSLVDFGDGSLDNFSTIIAENGGAISLSSVMLTNETSATFEASGSGSSISYTTGGVTNDGTIEADNSGAITFGGSIGIQNEGGTIEALSGGSVEFETESTGSVSNDGGTVEASGTGSSVTFDSSLNGAQNDDGGVIEALNGGIVTIDGFGENGLANSGGFIEASGAESKVELAGATVIGGTLETSDGGVVEAVSGTNDLLNVTLAGGSLQADSGAIVDLQGGAGGSANPAATIEGTVTFEGLGTFKIDAPSYFFVAGEGGGTLDNASTIQGAGIIGNGDGALTLNNETGGSINADLNGQTFTIDTGNMVTNAGTMEATAGATLLIEDAVLNHGSVVAVVGGTVTFTTPSTITNDGAIGAGFEGTVRIENAVVENVGLVAANSGTVDLAGATIIGGTLETETGVIQTVAGSGNSTLDGVTITALSDLQVNDGSSLTLQGTIIDVSGTINVAAGGANLVISGNVTLDGSDPVALDGPGNVALGGAGADIVGAGSGANTLNNEAYMFGAGLVGGDGLTLSNDADGVIFATLLSAPLIINTGSNVVTNAGMMEADVGTLQIGSDVNNSGLIKAFAGSEIDVRATSITWTGGAATADTNGIYLLGKLSVDIADGGTLTLGGAGVVSLFGGSIVETQPGETLENNGNTIVGYGQIGDGALVFNNNSGTVDAVSGEIIFDTSLVDNSSLLEATSQGVLAISGNVDNAGGTIEAQGPSSYIYFLGATVAGGLLTTDDPTRGDEGIIEVAADHGTSELDGSTDAVTIEGYVYVVPTATLELAGTIFTSNLVNGQVINGSIVVGESDFPDVSLGATLQISGTVTLEGGGTVTMQGRAGEITAAASGAELDNSSTITGAGSIGTGNNWLTLDNETGGIINADNAGSAALVIDTSSNTITNLGVMEATHGGTLDIESSVNNTGGTISASGSNSAVDFSGVTVTGGTLETSDGGIIENVEGTSTLSGVSIAGGSLLQSDSNTAIDLSGTTALSGGAVTFEGGGTFEFSGNGASIVGPSQGSATLVNQSTIEGVGTIGNGDSGALLSLNNSGTVEAAGGTLIINTGTRNQSTTINTGTLEAYGPNAALEISFTNLLNTAGIIAAFNTAADLSAQASEQSSTPSQVDLLDANITNGTLETSNFGTIETITNNGAASTSTLVNVTNEGYLYVTDDTTLLLRDTITNTGGTIALGLGGEATLLVDGVSAINGGSVQLNGGSDTLAANVGGTQFSNASIIEGAGAIGRADGFLTLTNQSSGTIDADSNGATLSIYTGATVTNLGGVLEATNGGTLAIDDPLTNLGTVKAIGGTVDVSGAVSGTGSDIISNHGILEFRSSVSAGQTVTYQDATGMLALSDPGDFSGHITGIALGDTIDLSNIAPSSIESATINGAQLDVVETGGQTLTFNIAGNLNGNQFVATSDHNGGTDLTLQQTPTNLVVNGGFETGNLNGWTGNGVQLQYDQVVQANAHSGSYSLELGAVNAEYDVDQTISTVVGQTYQVQFWLMNPGGTPSNFTASFGGDTLLSLSNTGEQGYTEYTHDVTATSTSTELLFVAEQNPSFWYLDDVSVEAVPPQENASHEAGGTITLSDGAGGSATIVSGDAPITIVDATATISGSSAQTVDFAGPTGTLTLDQPSMFTGQIEGFTGTAPNAAHSDVIDLAGINYDSSHFSESYNASTGVLAVSDGTHTADLTFDNFTATFEFASDGNGGTDIFDPPAAGSNATPASTGHGMNFGKDQINLSENNASTHNNTQNSPTPSGDQSGSVSIGGAANDHFVFQPAQFIQTKLNTNQPSTPLSEHGGDHANTQLAALVAHEAVFQPAFDAVHDDAAAATAQFHQIVASAGHLH
jgi:FecR protein/Carbohydrate binding domain